MATLYPASANSAILFILLEVSSQGYTNTSLKHNRFNK